MNIFSDIREKVEKAEVLSRAINMNVGDMADLIAGRLRVSSQTPGGVDTHSLCVLKKELAAYNMQTGQWRDQ